MKRVIIFLATVILFTDIRAQDTLTLKPKNYPAQVSIFYPIGTSGRASKKHYYNFSLNLAYGRTGGINGIEISGLAGLSQGNVRGMQLSGLVGFGNNVTGLQLSGLVGIANDFKGIQFNGLVGMANNTNGLQINGGVGIANNVTGLQFNGLVGIANNVTGMQLSGLVGIANNVKALQVSGISSISNNITGMQISGVVGIANNVRGAQVSGLFNVANNFKGMQLAGVYNRTRTLNGFQLAIVNVTDSVASGIPMGIVSIVKKGGYTQWEVFASDIVNVGASFKMGIRRFYSIYSLGYNFIENQLFAAGFGFGSNIPLGVGSKYEFQPELINYTYFPTDFKKIRYTNATQLRLGFARTFGKVGVFAAPSVYLSTMDMKDGVYGYKISPIGTVYERENSDNKISIGIGCTIGLSFR